MAAQAVISDGRTVTWVAKDWDVSRQTVHEWLGRYEDEGFKELANCSPSAGPLPSSDAARS